MRYTVGALRQHKHVQNGKARDAYGRFESINGKHDFKKAVPGGYVDYAVRSRHDGKVAYFNFTLAKQMGLIPTDHPHRMNLKLSQKILHTFSIQIINEYDLIHKTPIPAKDIRPNKYMATRYLQLQHPNKKGTTSGDGRSIWNGQIKHKGVTWDVSSCGTGATRLSPATAIENQFFKTGDSRVSYGCGYSELSDGIAAALMSEIFYKNGNETERTLAVIEFPKHTSINIRAATNLIRPSHFFHHLKQNNLESLKAAVDYFIDRQINNGDWTTCTSSKKRYRYLAEQFAITMGRVTAIFESEYIFVWLDWDGDNILTNGGIIDYGSVRQFGLFHHEYRYEDVDRMSTNICEQKQKAKYIVQQFAQIRDYLNTGEKNNIRDYSQDPILTLFEKTFEEQLLKSLLYKVGFDTTQSKYLLSKQPKLVKQFKTIHSYFEKAKSERGLQEIADGITWDAIYCMRDILRELPIHILSRDEPPSPKEFLEIIASSYASGKDRELTPYKEKQMRQFNTIYMRLLKLISKHFKYTMDKTLLELSLRSSVINRYDRITGDSILGVTEAILKDRKHLPFNEVQAIMENFIHFQELRPSSRRATIQTLNPIEDRKNERVMNKILHLVRENRESI